MLSCEGWLLRSSCRFSANFTKDSGSHKWIWCVVLCTEPGPEIPGPCHMPLIRFNKYHSMHEISKLLLPRSLACHACLNRSTFLWSRSLIHLIRSLLRYRFSYMHVHAHHASFAWSGVYWNAQCAFSSGIDRNKHFCGQTTEIKKCGEASGPSTDLQSTNIE